MLHFRSALRNLVHAPYLSAVIILSLAVGIGANTVIFSWLKRAMLEPLAGVPAPVIALETRDDTGNYVPLSWLEYRDVREMLPSFSGILAHRPRAYNLGEPGHETRAFTELVSENFFAVLGLRPQIGRFFMPGEASQPGGAPVVVISDHFWRTHFGGADDVVGRALKLNGQSLTVIGVTPPGFRGAMHSLVFDLFVPLTMAPVLQPATREMSARDSRQYYMLATLRPGVPAAHARGEMDAAAARLRTDFPQTNKGFSLELVPVWRMPRGGQQASTGLLTMQVFALLILVVVCANTATLQLARASARRREIGVRLALGAGTGRIIALLLSESVLLALLGGGLGYLFSLWGADAIRALPVPGALPVDLGLEIDRGSLLFALALGGGCGVIFGLVPALQAGRVDVLPALRGGRGEAPGRSRVQRILIGLEVAVALVVMMLAGMFLRSFRHAQTINPGYDTARILLASLDLAGRGYTQERAQDLLENLVTDLCQRPGVEHAAIAGLVPLEVRGLPTGVIDIEGKEFDPGRKILYYNAGPGYFATLGVPIVEGGDLAPLARTDLPLDAVINQEMARRYWPGESPLGRRFVVSKSYYVVTGVVPDIKLTALNETPRPAAWLTQRAQFVFTPTLHLRAAPGQDPAALLGAARDALRRLDPQLSLLDVRTFAQHIDNNLFLHRLPAQMLGIFAPLALALAAIGLYAVLAYTLAQRTQEIGVRLALGATPGRVLRESLGEGMSITLIGAAVGWCAAFGFGWYFQRWLIAVPLGDPLIYLGIPALLLGIALFSCWLPARRAARVDPMVALRSE